MRLHFMIMLMAAWGCASVKTHAPMNPINQQASEDKDSYSLIASDLKEYFALAGEEPNLTPPMREIISNAQNINQEQLAANLSDPGTRELLLLSSLPTNNPAKESKDEDQTGIGLLAGGSAIVLIALLPQYSLYLQERSAKDKLSQTERKKAEDDAEWKKTLENSESKSAEAFEAFKEASKPLIEAWQPILKTVDAKHAALEKSIEKFRSLHANEEVLFGKPTFFDNPEARLGLSMKRGKSLVLDKWGRFKPLSEIPQSQRDAVAKFYKEYGIIEKGLPSYETAFKNLNAAYWKYFHFNNTLKDHVKNLENAGPASYRVTSSYLFPLSYAAQENQWLHELLSSNEIQELEKIYTRKRLDYILSLPEGLRGQIEYANTKAKQYQRDINAEKQSIAEVRRLRYGTLAATIPGVALITAGAVLTAQSQAKSQASLAGSNQDAPLSSQLGIVLDNVQFRLLRLYAKTSP